MSGVWGGQDTQVLVPVILVMAVGSWAFLFSIPGLRLPFCTNSDSSLKSPSGPFARMHTYHFFLGSEPPQRGEVSFLECVTRLELQPGPGIMISSWPLLSRLPPEIPSAHGALFQGGFSQARGVSPHPGDVFTTEGTTCGRGERRAGVLLLPSGYKAELAQCPKGVSNAEPNLR